MKKLKEKLASSQDAYKSLLAKMETICKHCDEQTNKVTNLEAVGTILTKAPKKKKVLSLTCLKRMLLLLAMIYV